MDLLVVNASKRSLLTFSRLIFSHWTSDENYNDE